MRLPSTPTWQPFRPQPPGDAPAKQNGHSTSTPELARRPAGLPRQRRRGMLVLGVALVGLGILAGALILTSASQRESVVAVSASIPAGATITRNDLTTVSVAVGSGVKTIPARHLTEVTGLVAAATLETGTLLAPDEITPALPPAAGQQLVTIALRPSQMPASGLSPGDQVLVISTPGSQAAATALIEQVPATVLAVGGPTQDGYMTVDVEVAAADGPAVARQSSTGRIALIIIARRS
jgi:SAF domain